MSAELIARNAREFARNLEEKAQADIDALVAERKTVREADSAVAVRRLAAAMAELAAAHRAVGQIIGDESMTRQQAFSIAAPYPNTIRLPAMGHAHDTELLTGLLRKAVAQCGNSSGDFASAAGILLDVVRQCG